MEQFKNLLDTFCQITINADEREGTHAQKMIEF